MSNVLKLRLGKALEPDNPDRRVVTASTLCAEGIVGDDELRYIQAINFGADVNDYDNETIQNHCLTWLEVRVLQIQPQRVFGLGYGAPKLDANVPESVYYNLDDFDEYDIDLWGCNRRMCFRATKINGVWVPLNEMILNHRDTPEGVMSRLQRFEFSADVDNQLCFFKAEEVF